MESRNQRLVRILSCCYCLARTVRAPHVAKPPPHTAGKQFAAIAKWPDKERTQTSRARRREPLDKTCADARIRLMRLGGSSPLEKAGQTRSCARRTGARRGSSRVGELTVSTVSSLSRFTSSTRFLFRLFSVSNCFGEKCTVTR